MRWGGSRRKEWAHNFFFLPVILVHSHLADQVMFMLDLAQKFIFCKAEREEESLCGTYHLQCSLESWRSLLGLLPGMTYLLCDGFFSGFNFKDIGSAKGIPGCHILLSAPIGFRVNNWHSSITSSHHFWSSLTSLMALIWRRGFLAPDPLKQLSCPATVPGGRGEPFPWALPPHMATGQGTGKAGSPPEVPHFHQALETKAAEGIYWSQISWKQPWQSLWLHSCPVSWPFTGEVPTMLFCSLTDVFQPPSGRRMPNVQNSPADSGTTCGARHYINYLQVTVMDTAKANTGNPLQGNLEAFSNSSLCAYCGSTVFE